MRHFLLVFLLCFSSFSWGQQIGMFFNGVVTDADSKAKIGGALIEFIQNGSVIAKSTTSSNGSYRISGGVDLKQLLNVRFSKSGLVSKFIKFDLTDANPEDLPPGDFSPMTSLDMTLFKRKEGLDFSFLESQPLGQFTYNAKKQNLKNDSGHLQKMKAKIEEVFAKEAAKNEQAYNEIIKKADAAFGGKKYEDALDFYGEASKLKPKEDYPVQKILEIDALIQAENEAKLAEKQENQEYYNLIEAADNLRDAGDLKNALTKYQDALDLKDEQYPRDEIKKIEKTVKYDKAIEQGEIFLGQKSYKTALEKFKLATKLKPSEQLPKDKIAEIEKALSAEEEKEAIKQQYEDAIAAADKLFDEENFEGAKEKYNEALTFESASSYAKGRIQLCDEKIEKEAEYQTHLSEGNTLFGEEKFTDALAKYELAKGINPTEEVEQKIANTQAKIDEEKANAELAAQKEAEYQTHLSEGNTLFGEEKFTDALAKYELAKGINPTEEVEQKITDTQAKIDEEKSNAELAAQKEAEYQTHLSEGNTLFGEEKFADALAKYELAKGINPTEEVEQKIADTQAKIDEEKANAELAAQKEAEYQTHLSEGNTLFGEEKFTDALAKYELAKGINPTEEVEQKIADTQAKIDEEKSNAELAAQKEAEAGQITTLLEEGARLVSENQLSDAKSKFEEVLKLDKENQSAKDRIAEIEKMIDLNAKNQEKEAQINRLIDEANGLLDGGFLTQAKEKFEEVLKNDADNETAQSKIAQIENELKIDADKLALNQEYDSLLSIAKQKEKEEAFADALGIYREASELKPKEKLPKEKIAELSSVVDKKRNEAEKLVLFEQLKSEGKSLMTSKDYQNAKEKFTEALKYKEEDAEVLSLLEQAKTKLTDIKNKELEEKEFADLLAKARKSFENKKYKKSLDLYKSVQNLRPNEEEAKTRIAEIEELLNPVVEVDENQVRFDELMQQASLKETSTLYQDALGIYEEALKVYPDNQTAKDKVSEMKQILDDLAQKKNQQMEKKELFDRLVKEGNELFDQKKFVPGAKQKYEEALQLFPDNAEVKIRYENAVAEGQKQEDFVKLYNKALATADKNFEDKNFEKAKELYERAVGFNALDEYPKNKLAEIDAILNPPFVQSSELEVLGEPYSGSILDGSFLLKQAEEKREDMNKENVLSLNDGVRSEIETINAENTANREEVINEINQTLTKVELAEKKSDESRQNVVELLRGSEKKLLELESSNQKFNRSDLLNYQEKLDIVATETALDYKEDERVYQQNTIDLSDIKIKEQKMTAGKVEDKTLSNYKTDENLSITQKVISNKNIKGNLEAHKNKQELTKIDKSVVVKQEEQVKKQQINSLEIDQGIERTKIKAIDNVKESKEKQFRSNQEFSNITKQQAQIKREEGVAETEKYLRHKKAITDEELKLKSTKEKEELAMAQKVAQMKVQKEKTQLRVNQKKLSDEEERLEAKKKIDNASLSVKNKANSEAEAHTVVSERVKGIEKATSTLNQKKQEKSINKAYQNNTALNTVNNTPKSKVKAKNSLGEEYPEGVSQEIFTKKDKKGLINTVITRRIVVIDGHADVYVRTQTPLAITYSKNGKPSLSYTWNRETQGPHLERHY